MQKNLFFLVFFTSLLLLGSCSVSKETVSTSDYISQNKREYSVQSVLWQQNAAEYKALCYQAFNVAKMQLDAALENREDESQPLAIITDIDETVLDNSPFNAKMIEENSEYTSEKWIDWGSQIAAKAIPGAEKFLNYAARKGVEIFYISNRYVSMEEMTLENMKNVNFPYADKDHIMFKEEESSKKARFDKVRANYEVVMYLGDNCSDFTSDFLENSTEKRNAVADRLEDDFGSKFIVLPNPMYGDWETGGIYEGKIGTYSDEEKNEIRKKKLKSY